jgi:glycosyltransferase involved in cell wall biosynthesis
MPGVLIEAAMAALPVVTTDVPGATDVVVDNETGFIVAVDDPRALVDATRMLVEDAGRRARFGAAARARCVERFSLEASLRAWEALFAGLGVSAR